MTAVTTSEPMDEAAMVAAAESALADIAAIRQEVAKVIFGQEAVVEQTCSRSFPAAMRCSSAYGAGQDQLVTTLGSVLGLDAARVQFTPDLMPADILGSEVMDQDEAGRRSFRFSKARSSPSFSWPTKSTAPRRAPSRRCCRPCRNITSRSPASGSTFPAPSMCSQPRTRWSRRAPIRCRSTARPLPDAGGCPLSGTRRRTADPA